MTKINRIKRKLDVLKPHYCEIVDESYKHASHNGGITESHLKIKIFTAVFIGKSLLEQHKIIHNLLADELASGLHALSIDTKPPTYLTRS
ncbi:BolA family protein [Candidatus Tisiphia endosymbiont of Ptychoptera albimana]|uniref:BolA family protein n=1 Tax=Candidatus Tisiphia endosymbiont of Ptychoptera albimana TaxID=3066260 RepID=UPI00312C6EE2